jgi:Fe(3+) dicitrate transport protein
MALAISAMKYLKFIFIFFSYSILAQHKVQFVLPSKMDSNTYLVNAINENAKYFFIQSNRVEIIGNNDFNNEYLFYSNKIFKQRFILEYSNDTVILLNITNRIDLKEVVIDAQSNFGKDKLNSIENTYIYSGKKTDVVDVANANVNKANNNARQIFSKVSGINIFENDGSGLSLNIGSRGLNPNRSSNFNLKQNYYDISADALGYPESYYTPTADMIERIEFIRGAASLQFGPQFGGLINFKLKEKISDKKWAFNVKQSLGSFGLISPTVQCGFNTTKLSMYTIYQYKQGNGFRPNAEFNSHLFYSNMVYKPSTVFSIKPEFTYFTYLAHLPGGLTDKQFEVDALQSNRRRNWFKVNWCLPSLSLNYKPNNFNQWSLVSSILLAGREALGVLNYINRADANGERDLLKDQYQNWMLEARYLWKYDIRKDNLSAFLIGTRIYKGNTLRQQGLADSTSKPHFYFLNKQEPSLSNYQFPNFNTAVFAENIFKLSKAWSITPGARFEYINTKAKGYFINEEKDGAGNIILSQKNNEQQQTKRHFFIFGIGTSYLLNPSIEGYANYSQNYRSINFNDIRVVNPNFKVDANLKDEVGNTIDIGWRGKWQDILSYDFSVFNINYKNRIGNVLLLDSSTFNLYRFRTNVSSSVNRGLDAYLELNITKFFSSTTSTFQVSIFGNATFINAYYNEKSLNAFYKKKIEYAPDWTIKSGIDFRYRKWKFNVQHNYISLQYSDATNAKTSQNALSGIIPAYNVFDCILAYQVKGFDFNLSVNNILNRKYFTRRAEGYPGPGIIPSEPRGFYFSMGYTFDK